MRRIGILGNAGREGIASALQVLVAALTREMPDSMILIEQSLSAFAPMEHQGSEVQRCVGLSALASRSDIIFSLGGDGTMLTAGRAIATANPSAQLIGVNLGKLGFIAENPPMEIEALVLDLNGNRLRSEARLMLEAAIESESGEPIKIVRHELGPERGGKVEQHCDLIALNEFVVDNYGSTRMLTLEVHVDDALLGTMRADGIIVATPTGSTGYAVSAGGPVIEPTSPVILIAPIAPHALNVRPIIVPESCTVRIRASSEETNRALVVADGQDEVVVSTTAHITIKAASSRLQLLRRGERSYFDLLRNKLLWSMDQRDLRR